METIIGDDLDLTDRVVLVTGAARGLGFSYAKALCRLGAHVALHDAGVDTEGNEADPATTEAAADELAQEGGSVWPLTELLNDEAACRRVVGATLERFDRIDGLIHNAGLVPRLDLATLDQALYRRMTAVNTDAAIWLCSAALPAMRERGFGRIVLTTSGFAFVTDPGAGPLALYCHGKGAQLGLAVALAHAAGHPNILTNAIAPIANTRIFTGNVPAGSFHPDAVAGAVAWLASPQCTLNGAIVRAGNGKLSLAAITTLAERDLGSGATNPATAGSALVAMANELP